MLDTGVCGQCSLWLPDSVLTTPLPCRYCYYDYYYCKIYIQWDAHSCLISCFGKCIHLCTWYTNQEGNISITPEIGAIFSSNFQMRKCRFSRASTFVDFFKCFFFFFNVFKGRVWRGNWLQGWRLTCFSKLLIISTS